MAALNPDFAHAALTSRVLASAIEVHRALGPGMLESTYRQCLTHQLRLDAMDVRSEVAVNLEYKGIIVAGAYRADLVVENQVLVELKCVERVLPIHRAQVATYLNFLGLSVGLLLNFNEKRLTDGIRRVIR